MPKKLKRDLTVEEQLARGPVDMPFLILVVLLTGIGVVMVFSASYATAFYDSYTAQNDPAYYFIRQLIFSGLGLAGMWLASKINYEHWRWGSVFVLGFAILLLVLVLVPALLFVLVAVLVLGIGLLLAVFLLIVVSGAVLASGGPLLVPLAGSRLPVSSYCLAF